MNRLPSVARHLPRQLVIAVALMLGTAIAAPVADAASSEIEYGWTFEHGEVDIVPAAAGGFEGIVVQPTLFARCTHESGEKIWTGLTPQPDGSFWGLHQWFSPGESCMPGPTLLGKTAWRVMHKEDGSKYLEVCLSEPNSSSQPTIAPNGAGAGMTYGCVESEPTAPNPVVVSEGEKAGTGAKGAEVITFHETVVLPPATQCVKRQSLKLKLHDPKRDPLTRVVVKIGKRTVADVRGIKRLKRGIVLKNLPAGGSYTLKITVTTVLHQHFSGKRTYHSCGKGSVNVTLGGHHKHHKHH